MRQPFLLLLASGCGGTTLGVTRAGPIADASTISDDGGLDANASANASADVDSQVCALAASNYDQSCVANTDCVLVKLGDYCDPNVCYCGGILGAINMTALAQFNADVAKTPIGSGAVSPPSTMCSCPAYSDLEGCCVAGVCQFSPVTCPSDTLEACAEAGGSCSRHVEECGQLGPGPAGSCAQPDETCCLFGAPLGGADAGSTTDGTVATTDSSEPAASDAEGGSSDGFPQWWDPACTGSGAQCADPNCSPVTLEVAPSACEPFTDVTVGCIGIGIHVTNGNSCFLRLSDGAIIISPFVPASLDGLEFCFNAGLTSGPGQIVPNCVGPVDSSTAVAVADGSRGDVSTSPHCQADGDGLTNCGSASESCCTSLELAGGTYFRTYTNDGTGATGLADPATVSGFRLDKYDVTVGRFRQFVAAWTSGWAPQEGAGKHVHLNGGRGLANSGSAGAYETGWVTMDNGYVAPTDANLGYCTPSSTWTSTASTQETLPIDCVNWYEAYAFCIWDGGFLPSEAEWEYAAAGGSQQREYPWGSTDPGTSNQYAIYGDSQNNCYYPTGSLATCGGVANFAPVGTATLGAGRWGQLDLAGNVFQWNLDWYAAYIDPCTDCADMTSVLGEENSRIHRGGACDFDRGSLLPPARFSYDPTQRTPVEGVRCARSP